MRRLLFAPETFNLAEVTRGIEVAGQLSAQFSCVFMGYSRRYADFIRDAGFEVHLLEPELTDREAEQMLAVDQGRGIRHPFTEQMLGRRVDSERALIRQVKPEAVVIGTTLSQIISARAERLPLVYVKPYAYSAPHIAGLRRTGLVPRDSGWMRALDSVLASGARQVLPRLTYRPRAFTRVAHRHGVTLPRHTLTLLEADLNLVTTAPGFVPDAAGLPDAYRVTGPIFARLPGELPPVVADLTGSGEPTVYVAMGSSGSRHHVLKLLSGLAGAPAQILAPVASILEDGDRRRLPDNVHVTSWLPAHRLGQAVSMAITHGGEGTVQTNAAQGWPFIGIPLQLEQRFNVQTMVDAGSARLISPRRISRTDWAGEVAAVLADRTMHRAAAGVREEVAGLEGAAGAAREIVRFLAEHE